MAVLILLMFVLGWMASSWPLSPTKLKLFFWHKSLGVTLLMLAVLRLAWRWKNPVPSPPPQTPSWLDRVANVSHALLYVLMIVMPFSGWIINSAANFPFKVFGWFSLPMIVPSSKMIQGWAEFAHLTFFWTFAFLLCLHIGAALHHHFVERDQVLQRMWFK